MSLVSFIFNIYLRTQKLKTRCLPPEKLCTYQGWRLEPSTFLITLFQTNPLMLVRVLCQVLFAQWFAEIWVSYHAQVLTHACDVLYKLWFMIHSSCEIDFFVETHHRKLCVILWSRVLRVVCPHCGYRSATPLANIFSVAIEVNRVNLSSLCAETI